MLRRKMLTLTLPRRSLNSGRLLCNTTTLPTSTATNAPSPVKTGIVSNCQRYYYLVESGDICERIASATSLAKSFVADFEKWDSAVGSGCTARSPATNYCVAVPGTLAPRTTTATKGRPSPSSAPKGSQLHQSGIVSDCNSHYLVVTSDGCYSIEQEYKISATQSFTWNTGVESDCSDFYLGYYVCVGFSEAKSINRVTVVTVRLITRSRVPGLLSCRLLMYHPANVIVQYRVAISYLLPRSPSLEARV
ncbi:hypothetical protein ANO11243_067030 [Dothideomycetidae sp. 11243]|nr:hypothetical protein ANO11243_067030 [fungal sp. No.11243]